MKTKFIFVTGGVLSSLGKGLAAASLGALLKARGLSVSIQKLDPYINVDPGQMSPLQHGEVFVTDDGAETDLDLGHYERYLNVSLSQKNSTTSGRIYYNVISKERHGDYQGGTVQVVPHITDEIKRTILSVTEGENPPDVAIVEIGGTVGDIEGLPFLEAIRQLRTDIGRMNCLNIHLTLVPYIHAAEEFKTKPTQHSVKALLSIGIQPDIILCRCEKMITPDLKKKIALFCNVDEDAVFTSADASNVYSVPLNFYNEGFDQKVAIMLRLPARNADLTGWQNLMQDFALSEGHEVNIAVVGKKMELKDAYKSLYEALVHAGAANHVTIKINCVNCDTITPEILSSAFDKMDGILIPGGFDIGDIEGKLEVIRYAREKKIPFFGICLGMQCAVVEFARNVAGLPDANSEEFVPDTPNNVIYLMKTPHECNKTRSDLKQSEDPHNDTLRLGSYDCILSEGTKAFNAYQTKNISERHRHLYEFNNEYKEILSQHGLIFSGISPDGKLVEIIELDNHPWFVGCQFHPEYKSRPMFAHPLFRDFISAAKKYSAEKN